MYKEKNFFHLETRLLHLVSFIDKELTNSLFKAPNWFRYNYQFLKRQCKMKELPDVNRCQRKLRL